MVIDHSTYAMVRKSMALGIRTVEEVIKPQEGVGMCNKSTRVVQNIINLTN